MLDKCTGDARVSGRKCGVGVEGMEGKGNVEVGQMWRMVGEKVIILRLLAN